MRSKIYKEDQGKGFGKWDDPTSKLMYHDSVPLILEKILIPDSDVADYGGGNGLMKEFIPHIITIDQDPEKNPDILDDILEHDGEYNMIIIRFVLHYLNDYQVIQLFDKIKKQSKRILVIQFTNDDSDLVSKYRNSKNEFKYFRTQNQLEALMGEFSTVYSRHYIVSPDFYKNRLGILGAEQHIERLGAYLIDTRF